LTPNGWQRCFWPFMASKLDGNFLQRCESIRGITLVQRVDEHLLVSIHL